MVNLTIFSPPCEKKILHYYVEESKYGVERPELVNERLPAADLSKKRSSSRCFCF